MGDGTAAWAPLTAETGEDPDDEVDIESMPARTLTDSWVFTSRDLCGYSGQWIQFGDDVELGAFSLLVRARLRLFIIRNIIDTGRLTPRG